MGDKAHQRAECQIVAVGKRRDGGTRYWCLKHRADATAKYGKPASQCRRAEFPELTATEAITISTSKYPGGLALWGAVPPVYDTTSKTMDRGIHVHARATPSGPKSIDETFRHVDVIHEEKRYPISELDAIYFMVSTVFGFRVKELVCSNCGYSHLDKDWFSVHPHQVHLCAACGRKFRDTERAIGNPVSALREATGHIPLHCKPANRELNISQKDFSGGLQIWASNTAILWSNDKAPESGIHIHAFESESDKYPTVDDTFSSVIIDGQKLNECHVRIYMAQNVMPHICHRVKYLRCQCGSELFCQGKDAYTPIVDRTCETCGQVVRPSSRLRKVIANPILRTLAVLSSRSLRPVRQHDLQLLVEAP